MNFKWNRREFIVKTGTATLAAFVSGNLFSSCSSKELLADSAEGADLHRLFLNPPDDAKPGVLWHWVKASVSKEGITADLEAMKEAGIGYAYLMPIKGPDNPPLMNPPVEQLSPEWWGMVKHAIEEADRLGIQIGMHACDGFAVAGGPWITPELSMQKVVWTETHIKGGKEYLGTVAQPPTIKGYYKDIALLAFPKVENAEQSTFTVVPKVTTSQPGVNAQFLVKEGNEEQFMSEESAWIQYTFDQPFTCRSIVIRTKGNNYQAHRLKIEASEDGRTFRSVDQLKSARHGWQDYDFDTTHAIIPTTARVFRFVFDKEGTEPGAEDLEAAKWKPMLKIAGIVLSGAPRLHQYEGKNGQVWRIAPRTTAAQIPDRLCVPKDQILDISEHMDANGKLNWNVPEGEWTILRLGHTSTGHENYIGGAGKGLECDKFNPDAARLQFDKWFGEAIRQAGPDLAGRVLKFFFIDSWECGSQNWSPVFREEFRKRRGYDLMPYLPAMAGIPVESAEVSERFLYDIRQTITELVNDNFFKPMAEQAHAKGCTFAAESIAPTMVGDGMLHYDTVDAPMGEFWLNSPTHDKPNDILDAVSGAHVYGKNIVQAESFTTVRMDWSEHPAMMKAMGDRNYTLGINRFIYHVYVHNPWLDRKPGMTLDGVGLYFQRDQTWWKAGRAWVEYAQRCQALLQQGRYVADIAVFTGEEVPRRAVLPDRLVPVLPGLFGTEVVEKEAQRLANEGQPLREKPDGVTLVANMADADHFTDPLRGYAYDSINRDALLRLAKVRDGRIVLPGGASYGLLVIPASRRMMPEGNRISPEIANHLLQLVKDGATILVEEKWTHTPGLEGSTEGEGNIQKVVDELWKGEAEELSTGSNESFKVWPVGKGRVVKGPYNVDSLMPLSIEQDVVVRDMRGQGVKGIAWTHRTAPGQDIYFISNQQEKQQMVEISLRVHGREPELVDAVNGEIRSAGEWRIEQGRTILPLKLEPNGSIFVLLQKPTRKAKSNEGKNWVEPVVVQPIEGDWQVHFDPSFGGPAEPVAFSRLSDWSQHPEFNIRHYSGTAAYTQTFIWKVPAKGKERVWLELGEVANIAEVKLNGQSCGVAWTAPYRVEITNALQAGENHLSIEVSNTWANRLIGDQQLPLDQRITNTTAPFRLKDKPLLKAGLFGPVRIVKDAAQVG